MSFIMEPGGAYIYPWKRPGQEPPPEDVGVVTQVSKDMAKRSYYAGAMISVADHPNVVFVVFKDPKTGWCYAQPLPRITTAVHVAARRRVQDTTTRRKGKPRTGGGKKGGSKKGKVSKKAVSRKRGR